MPKHQRSFKRSFLYKKWGVVAFAVAVILIVFTGVYYGYPFTKEVENPLNESIVVGDPKARIVVVEYFDLDCPSCKAYDEKAEQYFIEKYTDASVGFAYHHMPLLYLHPNAAAKAVVLECAVAQRPLLYKSIMSALYATSFVSTSSLVSSVSSLGFDVDVEALEGCVSKEGVFEQIMSDVRKGRAQGIRVTPSFVVYKDGVERAFVSGSNFKQLENSIEILLSEIR